MNFEDFKLLNKKFRENFFDDIWLDIIVSYAVEFEKFRLDCDDIIEKISNPNITFQDVSNIFNYINDKCFHYYIKAQKNNNIEDYMYADMYFSLLEEITLDSTLTRNLEKRLKEKFKENYYNSITQSDNDCEEIKIFNLIKYWQEEKQRQFIDEGHRDKIFNLLEDTVKDNIYNINDYLLLYSVNKLVKNNVVDLEMFSILQFLNSDYNFGDLLGGKAYGLVKLKLIGVNVPKAYVVLDPENLSVEKKEMLSSLFPKAAIRSSANCEDGAKTSFAGMFDTKLNVSKKDFIQNYASVLGSVNNSRVKKYAEENQIDNISLRIVVQQFIDADYAGVFYGNQNNRNSGLIEWVEGVGESLVSGQRTPYKCVIENKIVSGDTPAGFDSQEFLKFIDMQFNLNDICDFEWCIKDNILYMLQYRPTTTNIGDLSYICNIKQRQDLSSTDNTIFGIGASSGIVSGKPLLLEEPSDYNGQEGDILVTWYTDPDWTSVMKNFKGIVVANGGILCHAAIVCRELGVPCVTGVGNNAIMKISKQEKISINGNDGLITF